MSNATAPAVQRPAVMTRLRAATRAQHRALDHHPELQRLVLPGLTHQGYARSLAAMLAPHAELEQAVWQGAEALGLVDSLSPPRLPRLIADLEALGVVPGVVTDEPAGDQSHHSRNMPELPLPSCSAQLLGLRYVLEGSRLGGEVLARGIREALGDDAPVSFLADGEARLHWQALCARAERALRSEEEQERSLEAARLAFDRYRMGLSGSDP